MIEICLNNKIIFSFLENYKQKKWTSIIPSLLEIAILNLYTSFNRYIFSEEDLSLIIENLRLKYNPTSQIKNIFKQNKIIRKNKKETLDIIIPKFRKNFILNLHDYLNERKDSYRSYTKKAKNINELNIYSTNENKKIRHYNKSTEATPLKGLINYNETDVSIGENRYNNIFQLNKFNKRHGGGEVKNLNIYSNKIVDYNIIDQSEYINNTCENIYNIYKNHKQNINYSFSIENNNHKKYIKVNKNRSNKKIIENNYYNDKEYIIKKDNKMNSNKYKESKTQANKINKIVKHKMFNNCDKKYKNKFNLYKNINQKHISNQENKNSLNLNSANYYINRINSKNNNTSISRTTNYSLFENSPIKKYSELMCITKLQKYKNCLINNSHFTKNERECKNIQFTNIKKNFKELNLRNWFNKERKTENSSNNELMPDIDNTISNTNNMNVSYSKYNNDFPKKCQNITIKNNKRKKIINYNSFNNNKNMKKSIFLNDPISFIKSSIAKKKLLGKKLNKINANGRVNNLD